MDPIRFEAGASLAQIAAEMGWAPGEVELRMQQAGIVLDQNVNRPGTADATLRVPMLFSSSAVQIVAPGDIAAGTAAALQSPHVDADTTRRVSQRSGADEARRKSWEKFIDEQARDLAAEKIEQGLGLGPVDIEVENAVLSGSRIPEQQAFFRRHPEGRILRSAIEIDVGSGSALRFGDAFEGNVGGKYRVQIEVPYADYEGGTWREQWDRIKARMENLYELATLSSADFAAKVARLDLPAGTRITRTFEVEGGVALSASDATLNSERETRLTFDTRWLGDDRIRVSLDTVRHDERGLRARLANIGGGRRLENTNHQTYAWVLDPGKAAHRRAMGEALSWTNGLIPTHVDTARLDALGTGRRSLDVVRVTDTNASFWASSGMASASAGRDWKDIERYRVTLPDHTPGGDPVPHGTGAALIDAFASHKWAVLEQGQAGAILTRTHTADNSRRLSTALREGIDLGPYLGAGLMAQFGRSLSDKDVTGLKISYHADDARMADVTLWRIDTERLVRRFAAEAGLTINAALEERISEILREHVLDGVGLERFAGDVAPEIFDALTDFAEKVKITLEFTRESNDYGFEAVHLANFNLRVAQDQAAFESLVSESDPQPALELGKFSYAVTRARQEDVRTRDFYLLGLRFLASTRDWAGYEINQIKIGDRIQEFTAYSSGASSEDTDLTEENEFRADHFTLIENGVPTQSITKVTWRAQDDNFWEGERRDLETTTEMSRLEVVEHRVGDGDWLFSGFPGASKNYGEGEIEISGIILPEGHRNIVAKTSAQMAFNNMAVAARIKGVSLPITETPMEGTGAVPTSVWAMALYQDEQTRKLRDYNYTSADLTTHGFPNLRQKRFADEFPNADPDAMALLHRQWGIGRRQIRNLRAHPAFAHFTDAKLKELLIRAQMADLLLEALRLDSDDDEKMTELVQRYGWLSDELTGKRRELRKDVWVVRQGMTMRDCFERPEMAEARTGRADVAELVSGTFREVARQNSDAGGSGEQSALSFWLTLFDAAGPGNAMGYLNAQIDEFELRAMSAGVDPAQFQRALREENASNAIRRARIGAGGPAHVGP